MVSILKILKDLIIALPEILRLIANIQAEIKRREHQKKVSHTIKELNMAIELGDEKKINEIFNN